jgi:hypothetical protein
MSNLLLIGWKPSFNKIGMNKLLRQQFSYSLGDAKKIVDTILEHQEIMLTVAPESLNEIASTLADLRVIFLIKK